MRWKINTSRKVQKQVERLPKRIKETLLYLIKEIQEYGHVRGNWSNYFYFVKLGFKVSSSIFLSLLMPDFHLLKSFVYERLIPAQ